MVLKTKLLCEDEIEGEELIDFYVRGSEISGWYVPYASEKFGEMLHIFMFGHSFCIKQEPHVLAYLKSEFVEPSKKSRL